MIGLRLSLALEKEGLSLQPGARIAVFNPRAGADLSALPREACHILTGFRPDHDHFAGMGYECGVAPDGPYQAALVCASRARAQSRAAIAAAMDATQGPVIVDGQKTDGIDGLLKDCRKRTDVTGPVNKAHGKLFWITPGGEFGDWAAGAPTEAAPGFITAPGVFSADGIDPASEFLADNLPGKLGTHLADLGAGWGYLSARILERSDVQVLHLVEADHAALDCARQNIADARAQFHWADALNWRANAPLDGVIMNPPFHTTRAATPVLGRGFIAAAATVLKPSGQLWMVANRHLPYEAALNDAFAEVTEFAGNARFKLLHARRPSRQRH